MSQQKATTKVNQARAIALLLQGQKIADIAGEIGVSEKTIDNWLRAPDFRNELMSNAQKIIDSTVVNLLGLNEQCVNVLTDILENSSDRNRLHAVKLIFETTGRWLDNDVLKRVERLESLLGDNDNGND
jgi:hypothetical protein